MKTPQISNRLRVIVQNYEDKLEEAMNLMLNEGMSFTIRWQAEEIVKTELMIGWASHIQKSIKNSNEDMEAMTRILKNELGRIESKVMRFEVKQGGFAAMVDNVELQALKEQHNIIVFELMDLVVE